MCTMLDVAPLARKNWSGHDWFNPHWWPDWELPPLSIARAPGRVHGMPGPRQIVKEISLYFLQHLQ